jgi:hypothetical protein
MLVKMQATTLKNSAFLLSVKLHFSQICLLCIIYVAEISQVEPLFNHSHENG